MSNNTTAHSPAAIALAIEALAIEGYAIGDTIPTNGGYSRETIVAAWYSRGAIRVTTEAWGGRQYTRDLYDILAS